MSSISIYTASLESAQGSISCSCHLNPICPLPHANILTYEILVHLKMGVSNKRHLASRLRVMDRVRNLGLGIGIAFNIIR